MTEENGIGSRMADFYFEITSPDGETQVFGSTEGNDDENEEDE
jgi:hypothetical protein